MYQLYCIVTCYKTVGVSIHRKQTNVQPDVVAVTVTLRCKITSRRPAATPHPLRNPPEEGGGVLQAQFSDRSISEGKKDGRRAEDLAGRGGLGQPYICSVEIPEHHWSQPSQPLSS